MEGGFVSMVSVRVEGKMPCGSRPCVALCVWHSLKRLHAAPRTRAMVQTKRKGSRRQQGLLAMPMTGQHGEKRHGGTQGQLEGVEWES